MKGERKMKYENHKLMVDLRDSKEYKDLVKEISIEKDKEKSNILKWQWQLNVLDFIDEGRKFLEETGKIEKGVPLMIDGLVINRIKDKHLFEFTVFFLVLDEKQKNFVNDIQWYTKNFKLNKNKPITISRLQGEYYIEEGESKINLSKVENEMTENLREVEIIF